MEKDKIMKYRKLVPLVLLSILISISCRLFIPDSSNDNTSVPNDSANTSVIDFTTPAEPLNVTVELDETSTVSAMFSPNGNTMTLTSADGTVFTLDVPKGALAVDTAITMTAVKNITGAPLSSGAVAAVQLEPSGLVFKEVITLIIIPTQEIPIEDQIIFGYEGSGQDYHLAIVDPKSHEVNIKLMGFSGAGVSSGGDKEWASNLQIQASNASTRFQQNVGEATQAARQTYFLTGEESTSREVLAPILDQFYDQVVLKEIAAADLDCKYAQQALQDLLFLERQRQLLGFSTVESITTIDFVGKTEKLKKIMDECKKSYLVSGTSSEVSFSGTICSLDEPFVLNVTFPGGSGVQTFTPSSPIGGAVTESSAGQGCTASGDGSYTVAVNEDGSGTLQWTVAATLTCPNISNSRTVTFALPLQPAPEGSCP